MKPWHRDLIAAAGAFCILAGAWMIAPVLALMLLGASLLAVAWLLVPEEEERDGDG